MQQKVFLSSSNISFDRFSSEIKLNIEFWTFVCCRSFSDWIKAWYVHLYGSFQPDSTRVYLYMSAEALSTMQTFIPLRWLIWLIQNWILRTFVYYLIILIKFCKIQYIHFDKTLFFARNQVIYLKNWKFWRAPTTIGLYIFCWSFAHVS